MQHVCVFCASSSKINHIYIEAAKQLGSSLAKANINIVCGGGSQGLMGALADSALACNGTVTGVIPQFMCEEEWQHNQLSNLIVVENMHFRKEKMLSMGDAIIALPGGCGTMEELLEAITWKQLGLFSKPIIIVNINGYYNSLLEMLEHAINENFMRESHKNLWSTIESTDKILDALSNAPLWNLHESRKLALI